jgi:hypothetical protein
MKKILAITFTILAVFLSTPFMGQDLTPAQVQMMTTKQFDSEYKSVFKSIVSLFQSEQYLIEDLNLDVGLITASKRIEESKKLSLTSKVSVVVDMLNDKLTEVKMTIYSGEVKRKSRGYSTFMQEKEEMVEDPQLYKSWFNNIAAEISRREARLD